MWVTDSSPEFPCSLGSIQHQLYENVPLEFACRITRIRTDLVKSKCQQLTHHTANIQCQDMFPSLDREKKRLLQNLPSAIIVGWPESPYNCSLQLRREGGLDAYNKELSMLSSYKNIKQRDLHGFHPCSVKIHSAPHSHFPSVTLALNIQEIFSKCLALMQNCKKNSYIMFESRGTQGIFS